MVKLPIIKEIERNPTIEKTHLSDRIYGNWKKYRFKKNT